MGWESSHIPLKAGIGHDKPNRRRPRRVRTFQSPSSTPWTLGEGEDAVEAEEFRLENLDIDKTRIYEALNCHQRFRVGEGYEMKDLPKFNDLTMYDVEADKESELWEVEVDRLVTSVKSSTPPSLEGPSEWYGRADRDGYNRLHTIAVALQLALNVCTVDNELLLLEHQPQLASVEVYSSARRRLISYFDPEEGTIRYDRKIELAEYNDEVYHAVVNHVTATLARALLRTMKGKFWVDNCLSTTAKFAAKLKVIGANLPQAVSKTFEAQKDFRMRMQNLSRSQDATQPINSTQSSTAAGGNDDPRAKQESVLKGELVSTGAKYFRVMDAFHHNIIHLLKIGMSDLAWNEEFEETADVFETSAVVYDTGFRGSKTQLCQERDGSVGAAADRNVIRCAGVVISVCREIWELLPSTKEPNSPYTSIRWNWSRLNESGAVEQLFAASRNMAAMKDVITALVPYLMFCGAVPTVLSHMARTVFLISDPMNPVKFYAQHNFLAAARISTSQYESSSTKEAHKGQFQNVFDTNMAREGALAAATDDGHTQLSLTVLRTHHEATKEKVNATLEQVQSWVIDYKTITITSVWCSWVALTIVGFLVLGGVALLAVGNRIGGVDPSNLTVLVWTAAGFLMAGLKSRRVENWPWRDFLHGRVVCRSVSEVQAVTKIDPQLLLAVLMRYQTRTFLETRGPFNCLFSRKSDDGFSIDVPPLNETAIAGGHIFIRVDSLDGPALVGLRARTWEEYMPISPKDGKKHEEGYICRDFLNPDKHRLRRGKEEGEDSVVEKDKSRRTLDQWEVLPLYPICSNELNWYRVQGVFMERALFT